MVLTWNYGQEHINTANIAKTKNVILCTVYRTLILAYAAMQKVLDYPFTASEIPPSKLVKKVKIWQNKGL